jgi:hypothetical protein
MCISYMKPVVLNIVQAVRSTDSIRGYSIPFQLYRLERTSTCELRRQVVRSCGLCKAEHPSRASKTKPRQRNLWVTDAFEWRPEVGLARPPNAG